MDANFKPVRIGEPDFPKMSKIREKYELLCSDLSFLLSEMEDLFKGGKPEFEHVKSYLESPDPLSWITRMHVLVNNIQYPGLDMEKLIASGMVTKPESVAPLILQSHKNIQAAMEDIRKTGFIFPLQKLWGYSPLEPERRAFVISAEFVEVLSNYCSVFTRNETQNKALPVMNMLVKVLNKLHDTGFINLKHGVTELGKLDPLIEFRRFDKEPAFLNKSRFSYSCKEPGDSFNSPNFSAASLLQMVVVKETAPDSAGSNGKFDYSILQDDPDPEDVLSIIEETPPVEEGIEI